MTAYACDGGVPKSAAGEITRSDVNYSAVSPVSSNRLIVQADADGEVCFYTSAPVEMIVDINAVSDTGITSFTNQRTDTRASTTTPPPTNAPVGPRAIPVSIVDLEVDAFARPADEACTGNTAVINVAVGGSIAAALAAAGPGSTIRVAAGTYVEQPDEWRALAVNTNDVCIRSSGGDVVIQAAAGQSIGIGITGDDIVIEGLVLRGFEAGIGIDGRSGETQRGLTIQNTKIVAPAGDFREGIIVYADAPTSGEPVLDGLSVLDVVVEGTDLGISCNVGPCEHIWIERTHITGRTGNESSGADAFAVEEGRQIAVIDSVIERASADGIDTKASDVVVFGCRLFDIGRNGVKLWRGGDVINTIIDGTGADGALVGEERGTYRYLHTLVAHHGDPGETPYVATWSYDVRSSDITVEIVNSIFSENSPGGFFIPDGATITIRNSIFDGGSDHKLLDVGDSEGYSFADLAAFEGSGRGSGNLIADPQFVDTAGRDYSTSAGSPARDAGVVIDGLDVDVNGADRIRGGTPDIGPVES